MCFAIMQSCIWKKSKHSELKKRNPICGICFDELTKETKHVLHGCNCAFCKNCLDRYFQIMIDEGQPRIHCPAFACMLKNPIPYDEIGSLVSGEHRKKLKILADRKLFIPGRVEDDCDGLRTSSSLLSKCPFCEHPLDTLPSRVNDDQNGVNDGNNNPDPLKLPVLIHKCSNCSKISCALCSSKLSGEDTEHDCRDLNETVLNELDIKRCPNCNFLIQREGGCAQISCRNCSHVFCWHCLKLLDNDFLLFHYDSGPCKNKLGHSRLMIYLNRAQTITVCVGFGVLMFLASPVLIILLPCVLTRKCRMCRERKRKDSKSD